MKRPFEDFEIRENVGLAPFTTWKIGGPARLFCEAAPAVLPSVFNWAQQKRIPLCILGGGSNILVPSAGIDGLVVRLARGGTAFRVCGDRLEASAAMSLGKLVNAAAANGAAGFDFLAGIPGTVGGAVFMNAGTGGCGKREVSDVIISARALMRDGTEKLFTPSEMEFAHRRSVFQDNGAAIISAVFDIGKKEGKVEIMEKVRARLLERASREPENKRTAGSVFKAADGKPAALLIDAAGLKGLRRGGAAVSMKHANWIENLGGATSGDVLGLIGEIRDKVYEKFNVRLEPEVRVLEAK